MTVWRGDPMFVSIYAEVDGSTEKAVLLDVGEDDSKWVPRAVIMGGAGIDVGDTGEVEIEEWFALKAGLI